MKKRILYFSYYLKELDKEKFKLFLHKAKEKTGKSSLAIIMDVIRSVFKYNISILEYFQFHFYEIPKEERQTYAGTGYMYEYQLKMNPKSTRSVLEDKLQFLKDYKEFIRHQHLSLSELESDPGIAEKLIANKSGKVVYKNAHGQCGNKIEVMETKVLTQNKIIAQIKNNGNDLVEEFVVQHPQLMSLSPSGLNTVRIITQLNAKDKVDIIGARLRITINSTVDNMAAGNIAAPINIETGKLDGPGVYSDITKEDEKYHPITNTPIIGFQVPFWKESIAMVTSAALNNKNNRSIGWDVAITEKGPELIEGNHNWCKLLWQLPVKKGLKPILENYLHN
jgi:predicted transcriptional regulator